MSSKDIDEKILAKILDAAPKDLKPGQQKGRIEAVKKYLKEMGLQVNQIEIINSRDKDFLKREKIKKGPTVKQRKFGKKIGHTSGKGGFWIYGLFIIPKERAVSKIKNKAFPARQMKITKKMFVNVQSQSPWPRYSVAQVSPVLYQVMAIYPVDPEKTGFDDQFRVNVYQVKGRMTRNVFEIEKAIQTSAKLIESGVAPSLKKANYWLYRHDPEWKNLAVKSFKIKWLGKLSQYTLNEDKYREGNFDLGDPDDAYVFIGEMYNMHDHQDLGWIETEKRLNQILKAVFPDKSFNVKFDGPGYYHAVGFGGSLSTPRAGPIEDIAIWTAKMNAKNDPKIVAFLENKKPKKIA